MHKLTWVLQSVLGIYFVAIGVLHFVVPEGMPAQLAWMYDLPTWAHYVSGLAEILGGLGLILPGLVKIAPRLTPLAATGLTIVMVLAAGWHLMRAEWLNIVTTLVVAVLLAVIAEVRWRRHPLPTG